LDVSTPSPTPSLRRWSALLLSLAAIASIWLGVLPRLANRSETRRQIDFLDARGIEPGAMFYTELSAMHGVIARMDAFHQRHPRALWAPTWQSTATQPPGRTPHSAFRVYRDRTCDRK
jgi:hypothetical protein